MTKPKLIIIIVSCLIIAGALGISSHLPQECDTLLPVEASTIDNTIERSDDDYSHVSFLLKKHISSKKWGFKKQVTFNSRAVFNMFVEYDDLRFYDKGIKYGIYKDKLLTRPVKEVELDQVLYSEETGENYSSVINTVLKPGNYYIGITAAKISYIGQIPFVTDYAYIYDEYELAENQECKYYNDYEAGDVYFKITASRTGKIRVEANSNSIQLCDKNKNPVSEFTESKRNGSITAEYKVMENQTYYVRQRITDIREPGGINDTITDNSIRYNYVKDQ